MKYLLLLTCMVMLFISQGIEAQTFNSLLGDESILVAQTKQVNQFFRRFNAEESISGQRYYPGDKDYRSPELRKKYIDILFDNKNASLTEPLRESFTKDVLKSGSPSFLDFHDGQWFSEVSTIFVYLGKEEPVTLYLKLEEENQGYKWVITNVYFKKFHEFFHSQDNGDQRFLHPLSHELDFMNLVRVFKEKEYVEQYTASDYHPDYLTLFLYEFKKGNLSFKNVSDVKFHFFQVPGWYFELSEFNRPGTNAGWLISAMLKLNENDKEILLKYLYHE
ncbi:MAG: hypothetical protein HGA37_04320 [Lentimicrobium sp.]|nr:hypothetical protein [Lentimicrobium sp.]